MTTGQRVAAKRKERELSQEALGEALGVSRQSIYKWESDASLPDIDKLIALSRLFGVSVGWLLGVEETPEEPTAAGALTDEQLKLIEELFRRYQVPPSDGLNPEQQAQVEAMVAQRLAEQVKPKKRRRWPWILAAIVLFFAIFNLFEYFDVLEMRFESLNNNINRVEDSVDHQIGTITNRVEEILKAQNHLTADYDTNLVAWDLARNTVTFSARVIPKTYVEGMEVVFLADAGDGPAEFPAMLEPGNAFTGEITCELTNSITLSAVFITGDTRQTQLLDTHYSLYNSSLPTLSLSGLEGTFLHEELQSDGTFTLPRNYGWIRRMETETEMGEVQFKEFRAGLFKNFELVQWLEPCEKPANWDVDGEQFFLFPGMSMKLEKGDLLHFAVIYTDEYGRYGVEASIPAFECFGDEISWTDDSDGTPYFNIDNYIFDP